MNEVRYWRLNPVWHSCANGIANILENHHPPKKPTAEPDDVINIPSTTDKNHNHPEQARARHCYRDSSGLHHVPSSVCKSMCPGRRYSLTGENLFDYNIDSLAEKETPRIEFFWNPTGKTTRRDVPAVSPLLLSDYFIFIDYMHYFLSVLDTLHQFRDSKAHKNAFQRHHMC